MLSLGGEKEVAKSTLIVVKGGGQLNPSPCKGFSMEKRDATPRRRKGGKKPKQTTATHFPNSSHSPVT